MLRRPAVVTAIALGAVFFLGTSIMLARGFSATNAERGKVLDVLRAQAAGNSERVLELLPECAAVAACETTVRSRSTQLRREGDVEILQYKPSVQLAITDEEGPARVAWRVGKSMPIVQCVQVRRTGALNGAEAHLIAIGGPLAGDAPCR